MCKHARVQARDVEVWGYAWVKEPWGGRGLQGRILQVRACIRACPRVFVGVDGFFGGGGGAQRQVTMQDSFDVEDDGGVESLQLPG